MVLSLLQEKGSRLTKGSNDMKIHSLMLGNLETNCYIWEDEKSKCGIVIDVPDNAAGIVAHCLSLGVKITDIILTHGHFDHILDIKKLKELTGAAFSVFEKTEQFLNDRNLNLCNYAGTDFSPIKPDKLLHDNDIIDFHGNKIKVLSTPGHTEDSICLLCEDTLISGDTLFSKGIGRWDFPTGDLAKELNSIKSRLLILPDDTKVYPGHGPSTTIGEERRENPYI